ncbi:MAG TPA: nucleotide exchange factor GrpE [Streptosporangiaceae bacterium]|nr:nucleotide exchange factor GrpE [Streptosporangiaceae bacterium]
MAALQSSLDRLTAATEREHERAAHREKIIDRLHDDNQVLRRGELQTMLDPIRTSLYRLHDMVRRESRRWADDAGDPAHVGPLLSAIADEIAEALARAGAERYTAEPGEPFDQARHKPVDTVAVTDPALDGAVVAARGDGFQQGEQVLRRAEVVIGTATGARGAGGPPRRAARHNASAESI